MTIFGRTMTLPHPRRLHHCGTQPIETRRLLLRPFRVSDTREMFENWASDPRVTQYLRWRAHTRPDETRSVLNYWERQYRRRDFYEWGIVLRQTGQLIGSVGATATRDKFTFEAGYCLGAPWWGQGIATEALQALLGYLFEEVGCETVIAVHAEENPASGRVMEKCGMHQRPGSMVVGTENGPFRCLTYEIGKEEFQVFGGQLPPLHP